MIKTSDAGKFHSWMDVSALCTTNFSTFSRHPTRHVLLTGEVSLRKTITRKMNSSFSILKKRKKVKYYDKTAYNSHEHNSEIEF